MWHDATFLICSMTTKPTTQAQQIAKVRQACEKARARGGLRDWYKFGQAIEAARGLGERPSSDRIKILIRHKVHRGGHGKQWSDAYFGSAARRAWTFAQTHTADELRELEDMHATWSLVCKLLPFRKRARKLALQHDKRSLKGAATIEKRVKLVLREVKRAGGQTAVPLRSLHYWRLQHLELFGRMVHSTVRRSAMGTINSVRRIELFLDQIEKLDHASVDSDQLRRLRRQIERLHEKIRTSEL